MNPLISNNSCVLFVMSDIIIATCALPGEEVCEFRIPCNKAENGSVLQSVRELKKQTRNYFSKAITTVKDDDGKDTMGEIVELFVCMCGILSWNSYLITFSWDATDDDFEVEEEEETYDRVAVDDVNTTKRPKLDGS